jgi:hypothetical protein
LYDGATLALLSTLKGVTAGDNVGNGITALTNGNFFMRSPSWDNGAAANAGAASSLVASTLNTGANTISAAGVIVFSDWAIGNVPAVNTPPTVTAATGSIRQTGSASINARPVTNANFRVVPGPLTNFLKDRSGHLRFNLSTPAVGLLLVMQGAANQAQRRFAGIRALHKTATNAATLVLPVFPPFCH